MFEIQVYPHIFIDQMPKYINEANAEILRLRQREDNLCKRVLELEALVPKKHYRVKLELTTKRDITVLARTELEADQNAIDEYIDGEFFPSIAEHAKLL